LAIPKSSNSNQTKGNQEQNQISPSNFKHSLSGLYGIDPIDNRVAQPHTDFDVLYSKSHQAQHELESLCKTTALLTQTDAQFAGVKSSDRALKKINTELNGQVDKVREGLGKEAKEKLLELVGKMSRLKESWDERFVQSEAEYKQLLASIDTDGRGLEALSEKRRGF